VVPIARIYAATEPKLLSPPFPQHFFLYQLAKMQTANLGKVATWPISGPLTQIKSSPLIIFAVQKNGSHGSGSRLPNSGPLSPATGKLTRWGCHLGTGEAQHCWLLSEGRQNNKKIPKNNVEKSINDDLDEVEALPVTGNY
jgi:hypothetical protein